MTTVSDVTFNGSTSFKNNSWGALSAAGPATVTFAGSLDVSRNSKSVVGGGRPDPDNKTGNYGLMGPKGGGLYASEGARLLFNGPTVFR